MNPFQYAKLRQWQLEAYDDRALADMGIDRFGNPLDGTDPRFRRHWRTWGALARWIETIVAWHHQLLRA